MTDFNQLKAFSDRLGRVFGTEDFGPFLYALVRMHRPENVLELGAGCGVTCAWMAAALAENDFGHLWAVDDGSAWPGLVSKTDNPFTEQERSSSYERFMHRLFDSTGVSDHVTLISDRMPPYPDPGKPIDLLFADFAHDPQAIIQLLAFYLTRLRADASLFIDSASTFFPSYAYLEMLVPILNSGRLPASMRQVVAEGEREHTERRVRESRFTLVHLTERKHRHQNSTAWLKIEPLDTQPYPATTFHS